MENGKLKMENEIIIDGVDVAGCKYYLFRNEETICERTCGIGLTTCKGKECDYKTIQRLEQKNKELIELCIELERQKDRQLKRLEQENKELGRKVFLAEQNVRTTATTFCEKEKRIAELEQENDILRKTIKDKNIVGVCEELAKLEQENKEVLGENV